MGAIGGIIFALFFITLFVVFIVAWWKIFEKAGRPGWEAIIPFYNIYILVTKIIGKPTWFFIMWLIPIVNYVFIIWTYNLLSKSFGKDEGFTVGLLLLGIVFFPILAFSDSITYQGPSAEEANMLSEIDQIGRTN